MPKRKKLSDHHSDEANDRHSIASERFNRRPRNQAFPTRSLKWEVYQYDDLTRSRGHVRMLKLLPEQKVHVSRKASSDRNNQAPIGRPLEPSPELAYQEPDSLLDGQQWLQGSMLDENLAGRPSFEYIAISHVWDNEEPCQPLVIDGKVFYLTTDTACLFHQLRSAGADDPVYVWMDRICINQEDLEERSHQVQQMDLVYSKAANVTIWLGEPPKRFTKTANDLAATLQSLSRPLNPKLMFGSIFSKQVPSLNGSSRSRSRERIGPSLDNAVDELLDHDWFTRTWVVQEAALARTLTVRLGWATCSWGHLWEAAVAWDSEHTVRWESLESDDPGRSHGILGASTRHYALLSLNEIRETVQAGRQNLQIPPLLLRCKQRQATDDKDKIFGLFGLLSETSSSSSSETFVPDYSMPLDIVYKNFSVWCVERTGTLDIISTGITKTAYRRRGFPSWVVDWSNKYIQPVMGDLLEPARYTTGMRHTAEIKYLGQRSNAIVLKGIHFDNVVSDAPSIMIGNMTMEQQLEVWFEWRNAILAGSDRDQRQQLVESFWTAIITDTDNSVHRTNHPIFSPSMCLLTSQTIHDLDHAVDDLDSASEVTLKRLWYFAEYLMTRRKPFVTSRGYVGLAGPSVRAGDEVFILWGGRMFFLLREKTRVASMNLKTYELIDGRGYVQDLMYGEGQDIAEAEGFPDEEICLV